MKEIFRIAIDGPSGAGKSTIAKAVAGRLGIDYIDTGAMYRAMALKLTRQGIPMDDGEDFREAVNNTDIDFSNGNVILDGEIVNDLIRTPQMSMAASACSAFATVRTKLVQLQQQMCASKSVIMDGRDICSVVIPDAEYKYFLTASAEERARRRCDELTLKNEKVDYDLVLKDIQQRDFNDSTREVTPLKKAEDAEEIDSTHMTIDEVVDYICGKIE